LRFRLLFGACAQGAALVPADHQVR